MAQHITLKEKIEKYLKTIDKLEPIINEIRIQNKSIEDISDEYEKSIIYAKINILEDKHEYLKNKPIFEAAVEDYMEKKLSGNQTSARKIAEFYGINPSSLSNEIKRLYDLGGKYKYNRKIKTSGMYISYQKEEFLLESLKLQFTYTGKQLLPCSCKTCFLLKLSTFAYEFAKKHEVRYPPHWDNDKRADILWLSEFEMRHSSEISSFCSENCTGSDLKVWRHWVNEEMDPLLFLN